MNLREMDDIYTEEQIQERLKQEIKNGKISNEEKIKYLDSIILKNIMIDSELHIKAVLDNNIDEYVNHSLTHALKDKIFMSKILESPTLTISDISNFIGSYGYLLTKYYLITGKLNKYGHKYKYTGL